MDALAVERGKKTLRVSMNKRRSALAPALAERLATAARIGLLAELAWKKAATVGLYYSVRGEMDSKGLMDAALAAGKRVLLPRSDPGGDGIMEFLPCDGVDSLVPGLFGIMEPDPATCPLPPEDARVPELLVVPGVAFDREGYRLGNGGGYYDRFLLRPEMRDTVTLGYGYAFQVLPELPRASWDLPLRGLCTDQGCVWLR